MNRNRWLLALALALVIGGGIGTWLYIGGGDTPEEASLSTDSPDSAGGFDGDFAGTWTVDTQTGSLEEGTSTYAGYRVREQLAGIGTNTAVGRTQDVSGELTIDGTTISDVSVEVDMTTLRSDRDMRDNALRSRGLETQQFPTATFELAEPITVDGAPQTGDTINETATGDLTIHGVTKRVEIPIEAKWTGQQIEIAASLEVALADYNIEKPIVGRVRSIEDTGTLELHLLFTKA
jgi:polyisoprenoid-binding protein YceI